MANVTFNSIASSTSTAGNFKASEMWSSHATYTGNFNAVTDQVNGNLNSINYSVSGFQSSNIAHNAILSQHITNNAVLSAKIGDGAVVNNHMVYDISNSDGVRILRCGKAGVKICRMAQTFPFSAADSGSATVAFVWSDGINGDPGFTDTPVPMAKPIAKGPSAQVPRQWWKVNSINSVSAVFEFYWPAAAATQTETYYMNVAGF